MTIRLPIPTLLAALVLLPGSGFAANHAAKVEVALAPTQGSTATGKVLFTAAEGGVRVEARVSGLAPGGHGFHVHEKGDCSAPDGTSAGGHFNPTGKPHGHPDKPDHHLGDMPMLMADASGNATLDVVLKGMSIGGTEAGNIVGRAVIVHAAADDFATQPTGNAGARLACGVIAAK